MQRKVIINESFGGYGWSHKGALTVLEKRGVSDLRFFIDTNKYGEIEVTRDEFISSNPVNMNWRIRIGNTGKKVDWLYDFGREDANAISALEEFGSEYCSDSFAHLVIEEFDDMDGLFDYYIDEYDGSESIVPYPYVTEDRVLQCATVEECLDLMRKIGVIAKPHDKEAMP